MHYDPSIEREEREDRQLSEWLRANPATPKPTLTVSQMSAILSAMPRSDYTAHVWRQCCEVERSEDADEFKVIRSDIDQLNGIAVVKDKESDNG